MYLEIENVSKSFGDFLALNDINLAVDEHEFVCLLGPSGCGKTTLLRIIAGLLQADKGRLLLNGHDLSGLPARNRGFGIVFQSYSLFPNMTVAQNIGYGLRIRKVAARDVSKKVDELLALIKLPELRERYPYQLSGGQQQRVAIARALAVEPSLILLDEPLSALDAKVRMEMRSELHEIQRRMAIPTIMVTHDQEEALVLADKVVCMSGGVIEQIGTPKELYQNPKTRFVADFVGISNLLKTAWVRTHLPQLLATRPAGKDEQYEVCIRPEDITLHAAADAAGEVADMTFLGNLTKINVQWKGKMFIVESKSNPHVNVGDKVDITVGSTHAAWVHV